MPDLEGPETEGEVVNRLISATASVAAVQPVFPPPASSGESSDEEDAAEEGDSDSDSDDDDDDASDIPGLAVDSDPYEYGDEDEVEVLQSVRSAAPHRCCPLPGAQERSRGTEL